MSKLIYIINMSLDGYIEDERGAIDWVDPDHVHGYITELMQPVKTYLYGRRMHETMAYWDANTLEEYLPEHRSFARMWQQAQKIVFSRTLTEVATRKTRLEREFDAEMVRQLKRDAANDIAVAGATLANVALAAGVLDECHLFVHPVLVGGGVAALRAGARKHLELLDTHRVRDAMHLHYRVMPE